MKSVQKLWAELSAKEVQLSEEKKVELAVGDNMPKLANEIEQVAGIFGSIELKKNWSENSETLSWFQAKGKIENIFSKLNIWTYWRSEVRARYKNILHPYRTSNLYLAPGINLGSFGQIHPIIAKKLNISSSLYLFEFNFELLKNEFKYQKLPIYKSTVHIQKW